MATREREKVKNEKGWCFRGQRKEQFFLLYFFKEKNFLVELKHRRPLQFQQIIHVGGFSSFSPFSSHVSSAIQLENS